MHLAKRACVSYLKCVHLMKDKEVFKLKAVDTGKLAESLGLATSPAINFGGEDEAVQMTSTMSRAEYRAARVEMLRKRKDEAKKRRQKEQQEQLLGAFSEGESLEHNSDEEE